MVTTQDIETTQEEHTKVIQQIQAYEQELVRLRSEAARLVGRHQAFVEIIQRQEETGSATPVATVPNEAVLPDPREHAIIDMFPTKA